MLVRLVPSGLSLVVLLVCFNLSTARGQLPSEAMLPGQAVARQALPSEATLPAGMAPPTQLVAAPRELPAESKLPKQIKSPPPETELPVAPPSKKAGIRRPTGRPWLRLNLPGHTANVRAITFTRDSKRLCSAGEDKDVHIWMRATNAHVSRREWFHERTVRWQVQRGPRGRIFCLDARANLLAIAGHGAMNNLGEILLVDPSTGKLIRPLMDPRSGHRQMIRSLCFAPGNEGRQLVSIDAQGHAILWRPDQKTGLWGSTTLDEPDHIRYDPEVAARLQPFRRLAPIVFAGPDHVVVPKFSKWYTFPKQLAGWKDTIPLWSLDLCGISDGKRQTLTSTREHYRTITAMAASSDGSRLASADGLGYLLLWDLRKVALAGDVRQQGSANRQAGPVISLCFDHEGQRLLVGTARAPSPNGQGRVQLWDVRDLARPVNQFDLPVPGDVYACAISPDGQWLAYSQDHGVVVRRMASPRTRTALLRPPVRPALKVAFAREKPFYRIAYGTKKGSNGSVTFEQTFDPGQLQLGKESHVDPRDWVRADWWHGDWSLKTEPGPPRETFWLYRDGRRKARLPLVPEIHGVPTSWCWVPDRRGKPWAIAVGTDQRNNIYVFRLAEQGVCPVLRQFRGHGARVTSLGVSRDLRYLVSGSEDATIRIWTLQGIARDDAVVNRWGATWHVQDSQLVATSVREDGPLYFRGLRGGDILQSVAWVDENRQRQEVTEPHQMLAALSKVRFDTLVTFYYRHGRVSPPGFQIFPAWQQVVSLFVSADRQWAYWAPSGYYDASFDGHKLFGWQVNRGVDVLPDFFLAAQLRKGLERPDVMGRLLSAGSLETAFRMARWEPPAQSQQAVINQYWLKPQVTIVQPREGQQLGMDRAVVRASISVRNGQTLVPPKAFANGVVAVDPKRVARRTVPGGQVFDYQWQAGLPADPRIMIQVVAATEDEVVASDSITVYRDPVPPRPAGKLYLFAMGINQYQDPQIQRLDFASNNARHVARAFKKDAATLYRCETTALLDQSGTRPLWNVVTAEYAQRLKRHVSPDDLLVVFLSGHGVRDPETRKYYYVTANAKFADIKAERYGDCISLDDFGIFADVPCRKLVILDTCHGGAIQQPLRQRDLKAALRALQDDVVLTWTASEGEQEAMEEKEKGLGRFTARLIEALDGLADQQANGGNHDGVVSLNEAIAYVRRTVADDSARSDSAQFPTAGPLDLLPYVRLPLTGR